MQFLDVAGITWTLHDIVCTIYAWPKIVWLQCYEMRKYRRHYVVLLFSKTSRLIQSNTHRLISYALCWSTEPTQQQKCVTANPLRLRCRCGHCSWPPRNYWENCEGHDKRLNITCLEKGVLDHNTGSNCLRDCSKLLF